MGRRRFSAKRRSVEKHSKRKLQRRQLQKWLGDEIQGNPYKGEKYTWPRQQKNQHDPTADEKRKRGRTVCPNHWTFAKFLYWFDGSSQLTSAKYSRHHRGKAKCSPSPELKYSEMFTTQVVPILEAHVKGFKNPPYQR